MYHDCNIQNLKVEHIQIVIVLKKSYYPENLLTTQATKKKYFSKKNYETFAE